MFDYQTAFSRNFGWVTASEQQRLKSARVAIAGLGGAGGVHALTLARLGVSNFTLADFDEFAVHNFNRQAGAFMSTVGHSKAQTIRRMVLDINPHADVRLFEEGVQPANARDFFEGASVYVDGIDFYAIDARRMAFKVCRQMGIPAITAAPLGMGVSMLYFPPGGMGFEDYFRLEGQPRDEQYARFIAGLSPAMLQRNYLVEPAGLDFAAKRAPSTAMACELCAGIMGVTVMKILLGRGTLRPAPWAMQFDAYRQQLRHTWRPWGNANPLQKLLLKLIRPKLGMKPNGR